jgi:hypothetical protein
MDLGRIRQATWSAIAQQAGLMLLLFPLGGWAAYFLFQTDQARRENGVEHL